MIRLARLSIQVLLFNYFFSTLLSSKCCLHRLQTVEKKNYFLDWLYSYWNPNRRFSHRFAQQMNRDKKKEFTSPRFSLLISEVAKLQCLTTRWRHKVSQRALADRYTVTPRLPLLLLWLTKLGRKRTRIKWWSWFTNRAQYGPKHKRCSRSSRKHSK